MKTRNGFVHIIGRMVAAVSIVAVAASAHGGPRSETGLARQVNKRLTIGRVVEIQPALQEAPVIPLSVMEAFPNADPELFETMPVGLPIVTIEIPNNEAVEAGLVDKRGVSATSGLGDTMVFYQPNDSGFGWFTKNDDIGDYETWAMQAILGNGFEAGLAISGYDILVYNSNSSINDASWTLSLWDGDPTASVDTTCNGGTPARIPGTTATFGPLPHAIEPCPRLFGNGDPTCVGLYRLRVTLPDKVVINCDRVWIGATMTQGCRSAWRHGGRGGDTFPAAPHIGFSDAVWLLYACEQFGACNTASGYNAGVCGCDDGAPCDHTDGTYECNSGHPTFCGDGVADYLNIRSGTAPDSQSNYVASVFATTDVAITLQPKKAYLKDGTGGQFETPSEVIGNEIIVQEGGANVMFEVQVTDWSGPDGTTRLQAFGVGIDSRGYSSGLGGALQEKLVPCTSDDDCIAAFGGFCSLFGGACRQPEDCILFEDYCLGSTCLEPPSRLAGFCAPAYKVSKRLDYALLHTNAIGGGPDLRTLDYRWGAAAQGGATEAFADLYTSKKDGKAYLGTMWLHVPENAKGTYTIDLLPAPSTVLVDQDAEFIPLVGVVPAKVTIPFGKCCAGLGAHDKKHICIDTLTENQCMDSAGICQGRCFADRSVQCAGDAECDKANPGDVCGGGNTLGLGCLADVTDADAKDLTCDESSGEVCVAQPGSLWTPGEDCTGDFDSDCPGFGCYASSAPASDGVAKNRYLSIMAGDPGRSQAIRVRFVDLPSLFQFWEHDHPLHLGPAAYFVGQPREVCENSGQDLDVPAVDCSIFAGPTRTFWAAPLLCDKGAAHFMDWHGECVGGTCVGGLKPGETCSVDDDCVHVVHIFHEGIVPSKMALPIGPITEPAVYEIQVADSLCPLQYESSYSPPLTITQSGWGDVCGPGPGAACSAMGDGIVDVANDVLGMLDKWANVNNLQKASTDLEPGDDGTNNGPDFLVNVANDILYALDAAGGAPYPFLPGDPCNPD